MGKEHFRPQPATKIATPFTKPNLLVEFELKDSRRRVNFRFLPTLFGFTQIIPAARLSTFVAMNTTTQSRRLPAEWAPQSAVQIMPVGIETAAGPTEKSGPVTGVQVLHCLHLTRAESVYDIVVVVAGRLHGN